MAKSKLIFFPIILLALSCDIINPPEEIPSYIKISRFDVEGINDLPPTSDVVDVWVNVNNEFIGVYAYDGEDITIPVLKSGNAEVVLRPGILKDAGFNDIHEIYPYYKFFRTEVELLPADIVELNPTTSYTDDASFVIEVTDDFETGLIRRYGACLGCPVNLQILNRDSTTSDLFTDINGVALGYMEIKSNSFDSLNITSRSSFTVPTNASQIWLEFDYRSNIIFSTGLLINNQFYFRITPFLVANPNGWKKVYLALIDDFSIAPGQTFNFIFSSPPSDGTQDFYLAIDNIRLIVPQN